MNLATNNLKPVIAMLVGVFVAGRALAATDVKLRERVTPRGSVVRLGDVAEIATADRQLARQLAAMPLMPAPAPGTEQFLRTREIEDMLSAQGVDLATLRFVGPEEIVVSPVAASPVSSGVVQAGYESKATEKASPMNRHAAILAGLANSSAPDKTNTTATAPLLDEARAKEIHRNVVSLITNCLNVKTGKVQAWHVDCDLAERDLKRLNTATTNMVCLGGSEPWTGRQRFVLSFPTANGQVQVQVPVFAEISPPPVPAVVAIRALSKGEVVKAADIELRMVDANSKSVGQRVAADSVEKLIGMEAKQSIQAGDILFSDSVSAPILVKRGDLITVVSQSGGIRVRTSGKALQDAAHGELVQVEAIGSKAKYDARVTGPREASVYAISRPSTPAPAKRDNTARRPQLNLSLSR